MSKYTQLCVAFLFGSTSFGYSQIPAGLEIIRPKEIDSVLVNPGIGFKTFQHFNGDSLFPGNGWEEGSPIIYQPFTGSLNNTSYPNTSIAYWRVYWKFLEPEKGKFRWDLVEQALDSARKRGQKLLLRIAPYGTGPERDVPEWYRKMVGPQSDFRYNNPVNKWMVDPEDARYIEYFGGFIRELGQRYDNHPSLEAVDLSIVGAWGEGAGSELLSTHTMEALVDAYTASFLNTPLLVLIMDEKTNRYANSKGVHTGWRADCIGDLGFWAKEQNGWNHMADFYPQAIIDYGLTDVWKTAPVSFEICGTLLQWRDVQKYSLADARYIFSESLKWHVSSFNAKSSPVPKEWEPAVNEWLNKMGYRLVLKKFSYPKTIAANRSFAFESWWENTGVAPCYSAYPFVVRLVNKQKSYIMATDADIRKWLPGDNVYKKSLAVPIQVPTGIYEVQIGIINPATKKPIIKLAIEGRNSEGWYSLGQVRIL